MEEPAFSPTVPGTARVEHDDDDKLPPPLLRRSIEVDNDSSYDKDDAVDIIVVKDVEDDGKETMEESLPVGCGHQVQTPTDHYMADFSKIRYACPYEAKVTRMCHHGAGYGTGSDIEEGFINGASQLDSIIDYTPPPCRTSGGTRR